MGGCQERSVGEYVHLSSAKHQAIPKASDDYNEGHGSFACFKFSGCMRKR